MKRRRLLAEALALRHSVSVGLAWHALNELLSWSLQSGRLHGKGSVYTRAHMRKPPENWGLEWRDGRLLAWVTA